METYREYQKQVIAEDNEMLRSMHNGMNSRRYVPGRMAQIERGVQHILNGYLDRMFPAAGNH